MLDQNIYHHCLFIYTFSIFEQILDIIAKKMKKSYNNINNNKNY